MAAGSSVSLELRPTPGGRITGRVIDDAGAAVAGVDVELQGWRPWSPSEPAARTDAEGRFVIESVASAPQGIWIVDGQPRPESWLPVTLTVRRAGRSASLSRQVRDGTTLQIDALVLERPSHWKGRVLDAGGKPVAGALVSAHALRSRMTEANLRLLEADAFDPAWIVAPGSKGFVVLEGEVVSARDGAYELDCRAARGKLVVWTPDGHLQAFDQVPLQPGEVREGFDLRLEPRCLLPVELRDESGIAIDGAPPAPEGMRVFPVHEPRQGLWARGQVMLMAELEDGRRIESRASAGADGAYLFQPTCRAEDIQRIHVVASNYAPFVEDVDGALRCGERRAYTLAQLPRLSVRVEFAPDSIDPTPAAGPHAVNLAVCLSAPERGVRGSAAECCGLGLRAQLLLSSEARIVELPLPTRQPYWIHAEVVRAGARSERHFGPLDVDDATGGEPRTLRLDPLPAPTPTPGPGQAPTRSPPQASGASGPEVRAVGAMSMVARLPDGAALPATAFMARIHPGTGLRIGGRPLRTGPDGAALLEQLQEGPWMLQLTEPGFEPFRTLEFEVEGGATTELGDVVLTPLRITTVLLLDWRGNPWGGDAELRLRARGPAFRWLRASVEAKTPGQVQLRTEAEAGCILRASVRTGEPYGVASAVQELLLPPAVDGVTEVRLSRWLPVELRLVGVAPEHLETSMALDFSIPAAAEPFGCGHEPLRHSATCTLTRATELTPADGQRRFRVLLTEGAWRIALRSVLYDLEGEAVEVRAVKGLQTIELEVR
jgi:hypothetical protein